jgi:hypothetical protein
MQNIDWEKTKREYQKETTRVNIYFFLIGVLFFFLFIFNVWFELHVKLTE